MSRIPYWVVRRTDVYPPEYYRLDERGNSCTTPDPKRALRHFEMAGATAYARALGNNWIESLVFFDGKSPAFVKADNASE